MRNWFNKLKLGTQKIVKNLAWAIFIILIFAIVSLSEYSGDGIVEALIIFEIVLLIFASNFSKWYKNNQSIATSQRVRTEQQKGNELDRLRTEVEKEKLRAELNSYSAPTFTTCAYCGEKNSFAASKCSSCGAKLEKK